MPDETTLYSEAFKGLVQSGPLAIALGVGVYFLARRVFAMVDMLTARLQANEDYIREKFSVTLENNTRAILEDTGVKRDLIESNRELTESIKRIPCQFNASSAARN